MNIDEIAKLIELLDQSSLSELEWSSDTTRLSLRKPVAPPVQYLQAPAPVAAAPAPAAVAPAAPSAAPVAAPSTETGLVEIRSPMVGTFYRSSSPENPAYVEEGSKVEKGKTVCIVEAMKLMNEIESEVSGTIVKVVAQNEQPVEYGSVLFLVRPS
ncbi:MAG: acetyl-CoA carboxylase biotin carboxyl carrier protein [Fibrobacteria bacterium]|nr:acetyl-CoA carboxylase biotin carboxyl carrier protein [Fibrobacteria bacterium]